MRRFFHSWAVLCGLSFPIGFLSVAPAVAGDVFDWRWNAIDQPCAGDCSVMVFGGRYVENSMTSIFLQDFIPPWNWKYGDGAILGFAASRKLVSIYDMIDLEPEVGIAQRFGNMHQQEAWVALFARYHAFPWNDFLYTTIAVSTGLNYATGISSEERRRAGKNSDGSRLLHYLAPEITFALPEHRDTELVFRFHHRSGGYGLISDADGGAHYGTVGLRFHF